VEPGHLLRCFQLVPYGSMPYDFRGVTPSEPLALDIEFGFFRAYKEFVALPHIKMGWIFANPTNIDLRTNVKFVYGDYTVEFVRDTEAIWNIMIKKIPSHWVPFGLKASIEKGAMNRMLEALDAKLIHLIPAYTPIETAIDQIRREIGE